MELKAKIIQFFDHEALSWDKKQFWNTYYKKQTAAFINKFISKNDRVLEIGCATGELLAFLNAKDRTGWDMSPEMIRLARQKFPNIPFETIDIEKEAPAGPYDVVAMADLVTSLVDVWAAFRNLRAVCNSKTRLVISYHNSLLVPFLRLIEMLHLKTKQPINNWLSTKEMEGVLTLNGFKVVESEPRILIPVYIPVLSAVLNRFAARLPLIKHFCLTRFLVGRQAESSGPQEDFSVSVVIPCLNEAGNIPNLVKRTPVMGKWTELLFVDGGSTDGTVQEIEKFLPESTLQKPLRLLHQEGPKGKGGAVRQGFAAAKGDILMILDSDISVLPEDLPKFYLALIEKRGRLINGTRLVYSMEKGAMRFFNFVANHFFRMAFSWAIGQPIKDTLCGTKALWRSDYEKIAAARGYFGDFDPFGDFDLIFGAARLKMKIVDIPVRYAARTYGQTKIHRWSHGWLLFKMYVFALRTFKFK